MLFNKANDTWFVHGNSHYSEFPDLYPEYDVPEIVLEQIKAASFNRSSSLNSAQGHDITGPLDWNECKGQVDIIIHTVDGGIWFRRQIVTRNQRDEYVNTGKIDGIID
jgi:hypothetical protein